MQIATPVVVNMVVEGSSDEAVASRVIRHVGGVPGAAYGKNGKPSLRKLVSGYANAAQFSPWLIMVDLDHDHDCAPPLLNDWNVPSASYLCFRVAVRKAEAWLLADPETFAQFFRVRRNALPGDPESLDDPKRFIVDVMQHSRRRAIRDDMVPRPGSGRPVGPAYVSRIMEFVRDHWRPEMAIGRADSLWRAVHRLNDLVNRYTQDMNEDK